MMSWKDVIMKQQQYQDMVRVAEKNALVEQALKARKRGAPLIWRILAVLGRYLVNLGCYLLERCGSALKAPIKKPCQDVIANEGLE